MTELKTELQNEDNVGCEAPAKACTKKSRGRKVPVLLPTLLGVILVCTIVLIWVFNRASSPASRAEDESPPKSLFYLKEGSVFHTFIDDIKPKKVIPGFHQESERRLAPIFVSGDGNWLFYPMGNAQFADLFGIHLGQDEAQPVHITSKAGLFTASYDGSRVVFIADHVLYAGSMEEPEEIAHDVIRYFVDAEFSRIAYLTVDNALYLKKGKQEPVKLAEEVFLQYVSPDVKTIYYMRNDTLYLVNDGRETIQLMGGNPYLLCVYDGGDSYYRAGSNLYYYSDGVSVQLSDNFSYAPNLNIYPRYYPNQTGYGGSNTPILIGGEQNQDILICKGAQVLKKISGGDLINAIVHPNGQDLYYIAGSERTGMVGDLFHLSLDGTTLSERVDTGIPGNNLFILQGKPIYFTNATDYGIGDMYINGEQIDTGVIMWYPKPVEAIGGILYCINTQNYYNEITNDYYTIDTLMLYRDGTMQKIAENVFDFEVMGDKIVYLSVADWEDQSGTLYLYTPDGSSTVIDMGVNALLRPKTDREEGSEIDPNYNIESSYGCG